MQENISDYINTESKPPMPPTQIVWAILTTIFCCLPIGLVSMVKSVQVSSRYVNGDIAGSEAASKSAARWSIAATVIGIVIWVVIIVLMYKGVIAGFEVIKDAIQNTKL